jgi:membrane-bound serine protease (ClpP class)
MAVLCTAAAPLLGQQEVYRVPVSGVIELGIAPFLERSIREAAEAGAAAIIIDIETPGGRVDAAQRIVKAITNSEIPIYALVNTHAWSAGAMIALAADSIFMTPGSSIGAATPVSGAGEKAPEKIVSAMRGEFRALAERRGLDPRIAEAMVDEEIAIEGVVESGKLLTLTAREAIDLGVAAGEVDDFDGLIAELGIEGSETVVAEINWAEGLVRFLSHPMVAPLLLSIGMLGLIIEIKTPSFGLAGATGILALGAFFGSHLIIGLAGWEEVILLGVWLVDLAFEVFVVPGFGIAGLIAIFSFGAGTFLALLSSLPTWAIH